MIRTLFFAAIAISLCPSALAECWKLKDGTVVETASKSTAPEKGAKRTSCRNLAPDTKPLSPSDLRKSPNLKAWVGSPVNGSWSNDKDCEGAARQSSVCGLPYRHWTPYRGEWSVDIAAKAPTAVYLYVAAEDKSAKITAKIENISEACTNNRQGGRTVRVGVYSKTTKIGEIVYAHLDVRSDLEPGDDLKLWGEQLGTVFTTQNRDPKCWMGDHVHFELSSSFKPSSSNKSCYNKGLKPGQRVQETNFIGFFGETGMNEDASACP